MSEALVASIGGALSTAGQMYETSQQNALSRSQEAQRNQQYKQLQQYINNPKLLYAKIMQLKQSLTKDQQDFISRAIASRMVQQGSAGATGLIQEAIADALTKADTDLFNSAASSFMSILGMPSQLLKSTPIASSAGAANPFANLGTIAKPFLPQKQTPQAPVGQSAAAVDTDAALTQGFTDAFDQQLGGMFSGGQQ